MYSTTAHCIRMLGGLERRPLWLPFCAWGLLLLQRGTSGASNIRLPKCDSKKIYVLDLNEYSGDIPPCNVDDVAVVNPDSGIVYTPDARLRERVSHKYGTHSAPWYVMQAIKNSSYVTHNIDEADIVFVDSYCYYIWWLGWVHTKGREPQDTPGDYLVAALTAMVQTERFKRNEGQDYVFYDSHPGFTAGKAAQAYWAFMCHIFRKSMHIVVERAQRNVCPTYWELEEKLLITPYVPNFDVPERQYAAWESPLKPLAARKQFIYAKARCTPYKTANDGSVINVGKKMRHDFVKATEKQGSDVQIQCTDADFGMKHDSFKDMLSGMQNSKFCLGLPGDAASVRRMSEMFMAGCLPVFAGPPYATMPLPEDVDYRGVGLFYNITNYHTWQTQEFQWEIHPTVRAQHPQNSWFWVPDADVLSLMTKVGNAEDVIPHLRKIPEVELEARFQRMEAQRQLFVFYEHLTPHWSAVNAIISQMCELAGALSTAIAKGGPQDKQAVHDTQHMSLRQRERQKRARRAHKGGNFGHLQGEVAVRRPF